MRQTWTTIGWAAFVALSLACGDKAPPAGGGGGVEGGGDPASPGVDENLIDEKEPNNSSKQPTPIAAGQKLRGTLGPVLKNKGDEDFYVFDAGSTKRRVKVSLSGIPEINLSLSVFDAQSNLVATINNHGAGEGERAPVLGLPPGKSFLRVKEVVAKKAAPQSNETTPYLLEIEELPEAADEESEPNEKRVDASPLTPGQEIHGYLAWKGDTDWYKIPTAGLEPGSSMRIDFKGVAAVKPVIAIYDSIEDKIWEVPLKAQEPTTLRNIGIQSGPGFDAYYVVVSAKEGAQEEERYALSVSFEKSSGNEEVEPNNERKRATPISNGQHLSGFISPAGDADFYKVVADAPAIMRVELEGAENLDLVLEIQNAEGKKLLAVSEGKKKEGEVVPNMAIPMGESFIKVSAGKGEVNDVASYAVGVSLEPQDGTSETEPNNDSARATPISPGTPLTGFFFPKDDVDVYRLDLSNRAGPTSLEIALSGIPKADLEFAIRDSAKAELYKAAKRPAGEEESLQATLDPGLYEVVIKGKNSNPRDRYRLQIEER